MLARLGAKHNWYRREHEHLEVRAAIDEAAFGKFDVVIVDVGPAPILVIREVRAATGLDLREAKELVENHSAPTILKAVTKKVAEQASDKLQATGCKVEVRAAS